VSEPLGREAASELRHELRTPVNHIVGYAEMLREDAPAGSPDVALFDSILATARDVLARINAALPPSGESTRRHIMDLVQELKRPQALVLEATATLLATNRDAQFVTDIERIAQAARRLTTVPTPRGAQTAAPVVSHAQPGNDRPSGATPRATAAIAAATLGRILIVDDVEENRAVLARRLEREGYAVDSVATGEEALKRVADGAFDLVLLDVLMPGMDGFAVLERIKGNVATRGVPVIMISALDDLPSVVRCIEHGAEDFLSKPFDPVLLRARIGASLEKKRWHDREADYLRQVSRIADAANAVEQGAYTSDLLGAITPRDDELGRLARVFDLMAAGVRVREERLRSQLAHLQSDVSLATNEFATVNAQDADEDMIATGTKLGDRYEILGVVGQGGMGVVYRARDLELNEDIAVKTLRRELLADPAVAERLKSEIRLARRISHRNVVRTHDYGEADGQLFVTMEYVKGITVRELLRTRGKLGVASTLALARQFAEALSVAHEAGVIHRDVKPENALLDGDGVLKVMDFGISRLAETAGTLTMSGMIVGTPAYMAPEQLVGEAVDVRADLYSLGVVMYECLTGRPPHQSPTLVGLIGKVMTMDAESPAKLNPEVPPAQAALVLQLLSRAPEGRPASAAALVALLRELG
jgi:CheY-like chemotaxis protein